MVCLENLRTDIGGFHIQLHTRIISTLLSHFFQLIKSLYKLLARAISALAASTRCCRFSK